MGRIQALMAAPKGLRMHPAKFSSFAPRIFLTIYTKYIYLAYKENAP